ncbi:transmembrane protein, putative [Medicago truncatula]|uniref:Transmembrane protein, putative n=1 Tax=Medicago truncatula TaxID=3880 RepID=G7KJD2_MEDTR|nr:transmembrane protein, putative [Medicago truncatula]
MNLNDRILDFEEQGLVRSTFYERVLFLVFLFVILWAIFGEIELPRPETQVIQSPSHWTDG